MVRTSALAVALAAFTILVGCAGRSPQPVATVQAMDQTLSCQQIQAQVEANDQKIQDLSGEKGGKVAQNVAAGVVGLFVWPVLFAMDFQGTQSIEIQALQARNQNLGALAMERCQPKPTVPVVAPTTPALAPTVSAAQ